MKTIKNCILLTIVIIAAITTINTLKLSKELIVSTDKLVKASNERAKREFKVGYRMGVQMIAGRVTSESFIRDAGKFPNVVRLKNVLPDECAILFRFKDGVQACISEPVVGAKNENDKERPDGKAEAGGKIK